MHFWLCFLFSFEHCFSSSLFLFVLLLAFVSFTVYFVGHVTQSSIPTLPYIRISLYRKLKERWAEKKMVRQVQLKDVRRRRSCIFSFAADVPGLEGGRFGVSKLLFISWRSICIKATFLVPFARSILALLEVLRKLSNRVSSHPGSCRAQRINKWKETDIPVERKVV